MNKLKEQIMYRAIINYRLSMESVCELFNITKETLIEKINENKNNALKYILYSETINDSKKNQEIAKNNTKKLFTKINKIKNKKDLFELFDELDSKNTLRLCNKNTRDLSSDEAIEILKYKYKYALTKQELCSIFNISLHFTVDQTKNLEDKDLRQKLEQLSKYNEDFMFSSRKK